MAEASLVVLLGIPDDALHRPFGEGRAPPQVLLFAALRREQAAAVAADALPRGEASRILALAGSAHRELEALLSGREAAILERARDGEWSLRDLLRHAIAVELRYREQVRYSATRSDDEPIAIPPDRLPCDRLSPPEPEYAESRTGDAGRLLALLGLARGQSDAQLGDLEPGRLARPSLWGEARIDVRERLHQMAAHLVEVTLQSEKMLDAAGERSTEARRILRRVWATRGRHERASAPETVTMLDAQLAAIARDVAASGSRG